MEISKAESSNAGFKQRGRSSAAREIGSSLLRLCLFTLITLAITLAIQPRTAELPDAPQLRSSNHSLELTLRAVRDSAGRDQFSFNGQTIPPIIRVSPGDTLKITYINDLPPASGEQCSLGPCTNMTNLHFHGLGVSPKAPQDDVLDMMASPGQSLHYAVHIPVDQPPGLYWYHTHPHGESEQQALDGMSGAIIVEGIEKYVPELNRLPEKLLVLRGQSIAHDPHAAELKQQVSMSSDNCGHSGEQPERILTINGAVRPTIRIAPGERQFWRIVNASADSYVDLQVDGAAWEVVALDGMPLAYHDPQNRVRKEDHVLLPPASRLEAIVTGPSGKTSAMLRTRCVDTGPDGDPSPAMVLADLSPISALANRVRISNHPDFEFIARKQAISGWQFQPALYKRLDLKNLETTPPQFVATFTEDKGGFYINGQKYFPNAEPMLRVKVGTFQHWQVVNNTRELHPMHLHQVHFLVYAENGLPVAHPVWLDTVSVPYGGGTVDMIVDFTNPVIRGVSVFHCHLLNHEDKGMMAKILFE